MTDQPTLSPDPRTSHQTAVSRRRRWPLVATAALAAALTGQAGNGPIVCIISGGNIDLQNFCELVG